ncbi:MAG: leucyl aminopeptidase, partial [Rhodospirillales bacterium]|nr:leucyl aminopeptidase [Rhodospirillales bacterium]
MKISFVEPTLPTTGTVVLGLADAVPSGPAAGLDRAAGGALRRAIAAADFKGKKDETLNLTTPAGLKLDRAVLVGLGPKDLDEAGWAALGGTIYATLASARVAKATIALPLPSPEAAAALALGLKLRSYKFDKYKSKKKDDRPGPQAIEIAVAKSAAAKKAYGAHAALADGVFLTRDLVTEPPNVLYPQSFAKRAQQALAPLGVKVEILGTKEMKKLGMGALLGVAQGSTFEPQLVVMHWNGASGNAKGGKKSQGKGNGPIAFVGKGVTFDSGGISIKPGAGMWDMKWDMGGAGVVTGLMAALAGRKAKVDAVGIIGLVENMPDGNAQRPGDVVTSMSGQTIEVLNTDAEGRLVLADALWYAQDRFKPAMMIDLATLTGAVMVALGTEYAGLMATDDKLADELLAAGQRTGELLWRLPLSEAFDKAIDCDVADMKNIANDRNAGSSIGGQFLARFVNGVPWA